VKKLSPNEISVKSAWFLVRGKLLQPPYKV